MRKHKNKIDWHILQVANNETERNDPEYETEFWTSGFSKYGYGEIIVIGKNRNAYKIADLINTFARMLISGEKFNPSSTHCIDDRYGQTEYIFNVFYGMYDDGERWIQLIPDFK